jgi:hypothetical protein
MKGIITVREQNSNGSILVGAFYLPTNEVANNKDNDGKTHIPDPLIVIDYETH